MEREARQAIHNEMLPIIRSCSGLRVNVRLGLHPLFDRHGSPSSSPLPRHNQKETATVLLQQVEREHAAREANVSNSLSKFKKRQSIAVPKMRGAVSLPNIHQDQNMRRRNEFDVFSHSHCVACASFLQFSSRLSKRPGAKQSKFVKHGGRSKLVKSRFEIDMDEFGVDKDVIRTSSTRSIR